MCPICAASPLRAIALLATFNGPTKRFLEARFSSFPVFARSSKQTNNNAYVFRARLSDNCSGSRGEKMSEKVNHIIIYHNNREAKLIWLKNVGSWRRRRCVMLQDSPRTRETRALVVGKAIHGKGGGREHVEEYQSVRVCVIDFRARFGTLIPTPSPGFHPSPTAPVFYRFAPCTTECSLALQTLAGKRLSAP